MKIARSLAAMAALACASISGQGQAFTLVASGTTTTDANGVIIIPLAPLNHLGHLWRNKFSWSSDIPVSIGISQSWDMTIGTRSYWNGSTRPAVYVPGTITTYTNQGGIQQYGTFSKLVEGFEGPWSGVSQYTSYQDSNYTAAFIARAAPNTNVNFTLKVGSAPEPTTWAMMILGFGAVGMAARRMSRPALSAH